LQSENVSTGKLDYLGIGVSLACAIHCIATPLVIAFLPVFAHSIPGSEKVHRVIALAVISVGAIAFRSGLKRHRRPIVLLPMAVGMAIIVGAVLFGDSLTHIWETGITMCGSFFVIVAHTINHSFCRDCKVCIPARPSED
jgi:MerC mercury resistance protein